MKKDPTKKRTHKIGRFFVSSHFVDDIRNHEALQKLMAGMIVLRAEKRFDIRGFEYVALCEMFDEVPEEIYAPFYNIEVKRIAEPGAPIDYEFTAVRTTDHLSALSLVRQGLKNARKPTLIDEARLALAEMLFSLQLWLAPKRTNEGLALVWAIREYALNVTKNRK